MLEPKVIFQIISIIYLSISIGFIVSKEYYKKHFKDIANNAGILYLSAFIATIIGYLIIYYYHPLENNILNIIVKILGWITLIKGIILFIFPSYINIFKDFLKFDCLYRVIIIPLFIGLICAYLGFIY